MNRLRKFFRLPRSERWLLIKAALLLGAIRIGLRLIPFQSLKQLLDSASKSRAASQFSADRIAWAVTAASRYVLGDKPCLTQALAASYCLNGGGIQPALESALHGRMEESYRPTPGLRARTE